MHAVVTGGTGFLMAHVVRAWLARDDRATATVVATGPPDRDVVRYLGDVGERTKYLAGDVRRPDAWEAAVARPVDVVAHGAALCPMPRGGDHAEERARLVETVDVNVMGTVAVLDWARRLPGLRRILYVSSGVYGYGRIAAGAPHDPPIGEDAPLQPQDATYDITKAAGEWLTGRIAALHGLDCVAVRPSAIFGPLDRDTDGRSVHPAPWHMARAAIAERTFTVNDPDARYDWLYAPDAGRAIAGLMAAPTLDHAVYNVGYGRPVALADLARGVARAIPGFRMEAAAAPEHIQPADRRGGVWSVRATTRLEAQLDWRPTPVEDAMEAYVRHLMAGAAA